MFSMGAQWMHGISRFSGDGKTTSEFTGCDARGGTPPLPAGQYCHPVEAMAKKYGLAYKVQQARTAYWDYDGTFLGNDDGSVPGSGSGVGAGIGHDYGTDTNHSTMLGWLVWNQPGGSKTDKPVQNGLDTDQSLPYSELAHGGDTTPANKVRWRKFEIHQNIDGEYGTDPSNMSWKNFYLDLYYNDTDGTLSNSYQDVTNILLNRISGVNILYNSIVTNVKTSSPASVTYTVGGVTQPVLNVDYIISTVPVTLLQRQTITFTPALSSAFMTSLSHLGMGVLEKVLLIFDRAFWRPAVQADVGWLGFASNNTGEYEYMILYDTWAGQYAIEAFTSSGWAMNDTMKSDTAVQTRLVQIYQSMFPSAIINVVGMVRSNWTNNPWSYGSYSYEGVGYTKGTDYNNLVSNTGRLYWAGEHTRKDFISTVHGAMYSGQDAANSICKALNGCSSLVRHPDTIYP